MHWNDEKLPERSQGKLLVFLLNQCFSKSAMAKMNMLKKKFLFVWSILWVAY